MLQITISKRAALIIGVALLLVIPGVATATHIFTDVVDGGTHAEGIEWVANAGVTAGCGDGTTYCPNDAVNRAQMGTFMCRLAGNCGVAPSVDAATADSATTAGDADTVDGYDAADLTRVSYAVSAGSALTGASGTVLTTSITAPIDGYLVIHGQSDTWNSAVASDLWVCWLELDDVFVSSSERVGEFIAGDGDSEDDCATHTVVPVTAGTYTVDFEGSFGDASTIFDQSVLSVMFVPFDGTGMPPSDFTVVAPPVQGPENS